MGTYSVCKSDKYFVKHPNDEYKEIFVLKQAIRKSRAYDRLNTGAHCYRMDNYS